MFFTLSSMSTAHWAATLSKWNQVGLWIIADNSSDYRFFEFEYFKTKRQRRYHLFRQTVFKCFLIKILYSNFFKAILVRTPYAHIVLTFNDINKEVNAFYLTNDKSFATVLILFLNFFSTFFDNKSDLSKLLVNCCFLQSFVFSTCFAYTLDHLVNWTDVWIFRSDFSVSCFFLCIFYLHCRVDCMLFSFLATFRRNVGIILDFGSVVWCFRIWSKDLRIVRVFHSILGRNHVRQAMSGFLTL